MSVVKIPNYQSDQDDLLTKNEPVRGAPFAEKRLDIVQYFSSASISIILPDSMNIFIYFVLKTEVQNVLTCVLV